jgi:hypothetical protein
MKAETESRYRNATEARFGPIPDGQWWEMADALDKQRRAHYAVAKNLKAGVLVAYKCQVCGSNESEAHHPDYEYPLAVIWLCRQHHAQEHAHLERLTDCQRTLRKAELRDLAKRLNGEIADFTMDEALAGTGCYRDDAVEYDDAETGEPETAPQCCPTCKRPL